MVGGVKRFTCKGQVDGYLYLSRRESQNDGKGGVG